MFIKIFKCASKIRGIPPVEILGMPGVRDDGMPQVTTILKAIDPFNVAAVVASVRMSPGEARSVAAQLCTAADAAEAQRSRRV